MRRFDVRFAILVLLGWTALPSLKAAPPIPNGPIHTNRQRFRIPFHFDAAEARRLGYREVRLFQSVDRGRSWQVVQTVAPQAGSFQFQAAADGEHWFAVRTRDWQGAVHPDEPLAAGLRVVVDTRRPLLDLRLVTLRPGEVQLQWRATDAHLDITSLRLEYVQPGQADWRQVAVAPQRIGQTSWRIPSGGRVAVRGSIKDLAGNIARQQQQAQIPGAGAAVPKPEVPDFQEPIAVDDFPPLADSENALPPIPEATDDQDWPPQSQHSFAADIPDERPSVVQDRYSGPSPAPEVQEPRRSKQSLVRAIDSLRFHLGYQLDDVGPSGVGGVVLYVTEDDGQQWWRYGEDPDRKSPIEVEVPEEGTYGFVLRARSGAGLASAPPQPGEKPQVVVVVDRTPPVARLLPMPAHTARRGNELQIRWTMTDRFADDNPIALSYAETVEGPWKPITTWSPNNGHYVWRLTPEIPPKVFVRLSARDAAGNVTHVTSKKPIISDMARPTATILDIATPPSRR